MSIQANWIISGTNFDKSADSFVKSAKIATNVNNLKKYEHFLNQQFKQHIIDNIYRSGIEGENLENAFALQISDGTINFVNTAPLITQRYEYGYYDNDDDYDESDYIIETSPRYFIRPSIQESLNDIGNLMLNEAKKSYINEASKARKDETL